MNASDFLSDALSFDDIPGWAEDDHGAALGAFHKSALTMQEGAPKSRGLGINGDMLRQTAKWLLTLDEGILGKEARYFFEDHFVPRLVKPAREASTNRRGFVTGYYEPEVRGSRTQSAQYNAPLLKRPRDLVRVADVPDDQIPEDWNPEIRFARQSQNGISLYDDRAAISSGSIDDQDLAFVYLEDPVDAFFIHIQGSARIRLDDDTIMRVSYAAKSGHDYTPIGRVLIDRGEIAREDMSMEAIRNWLWAHPEQQNDIMWRNRSFIFFDEITNLDPTEGPVGAGKVPLTPFRSLAVDRTLHTYGCPIFVNADLDDGFRHLMIAQDTGSAIVGPARGDIYFGSGDEAEKIAGAVQHSADFFLLWPKIQPL